MPTDRATPLFEHPDIHRRRWLLLGVMCLSLVLVVMSVSSLNVAAPRLQQELAATSTQLHWIIDSYALVFAGLLLSAGALGDRFGRKGALLGGLGVFAAGLAVAGVATTAGQVIAGRSIMGVGAAFVMPATLSLITAVFPPEERARAIATWAGFAGAGAAIGPVVAGALLERFWWGSAVLVNLPVVVLAAVAVAALAPRSRDAQATPLDPVGSVLALVGMVSLLFGIIEGAERGWTDGLVLGAFAAAVVLLAGFVAWEARSPHPMLPLGLFRDRRFSVASGAITLSFFCLFGFYFLTTLYTQYVLGYSPFIAGLAGLPLAVAMIAVSPRSAVLSERFGPGAVIAGGFVVIGAGLALFTQVRVDTPYPVVALGFTLIGAGLAATAAPATGTLMSAVPLDKAGVGSAVNDTTREFGGALGIAVFGTLVGSLYRSNVADAGLSGGQVEQAGESIGQAWGVAQGVPDGGEALLATAQQAFVDAFRLTNAVSLAVAALAAALVWATLRPSHVAAAGAAQPAPGLPVSTGPVPVGVAELPVLDVSPVLDVHMGVPGLAPGLDAPERRGAT
jgi:MFS transporter, DHA2 family, multidrug resistance protein